VFVVALVFRESDKVEDPDPENRDPDLLRTVVYKSTDGGHTYTISSRFPFIDREYVDVDRTKGKYAGRVYLIGQGSVQPVAGATSRSSLQLFRSPDGGKTFQGPVHAQYPRGLGHLRGWHERDSLRWHLYRAIRLHEAGSRPGAGNRTVDWPQRRAPRDHVKGRRRELHDIAQIDDVKLDRPRSQGDYMAQLAVDPGTAAFKDRVYVVFPSIIDDRVQIRSAYSADKGKTWSTPVIVNDDRSPEKGGRGPDHILPSIGVNKDGVVLITWYDRRDARDNLGWRLRAAASLDGGETFSESVPITDAANTYTASTPWILDARGGAGDPASLSVGLNRILYLRRSHDWARRRRRRDLPPHVDQRSQRRCAALDQFDQG